jgi:hypothetical protein
MIHHAFFLAASSVEITKVMTLAAIIKNSTHITRYNATLIKGYMSFSYKFCANCTHTGSDH